MVVFVRNQTMGMITLKMMTLLLYTRLNTSHISVVCKMHTTQIKQQNVLLMATGYAYADFEGQASNKRFSFPSQAMRPALELHTHRNHFVSSYDEFTKYECYSNNHCHLGHNAFRTMSMFILAAHQHKHNAFSRMRLLKT